MSAARTKRCTEGLRRKVEGRLELVKSTLGSDIYSQSRLLYQYGSCSNVHPNAKLYPLILNNTAHLPSPCDPYAYIIACCPLGWTCMSNLICVITDPNYSNASFPVGTTIRGTCTNPAWNNTACGDFCLNEPSNQNTGLLTPCGNNNFCFQHEAGQGLCDCRMCIEA